MAQDYFTSGLIKTGESGSEETVAAVTSFSREYSAEKNEVRNADTGKLPDYIDGNHTFTGSVEAQLMGDASSGVFTTSHEALKTAQRNGDTLNMIVEWKNNSGSTYKEEAEFLIDTSSEELPMEDRGEVATVSFDVVFVEEFTEVTTT